MLAVTDAGRGMKAMADSEEDDNEMGYKQPTINVTVSPIINMPDVKPTFKFDMPEALTIPAPQVTVNVPEQAAPIVNVAAPHTDTRTVTFPNVLSGVPLSRLREYMQDIALKEIRLQLGVDN